MNRLIAAANISFGNTFTLYFKSQSYHWNLETFDFPQFHDFFGDMYSEIYGVVDTFAEFIRTLDGYAPISLAEVLKYAAIKEDVSKPKSLQEMLANITQDNNLMIESLDATFKEAITANEQGFANFLAERLTAHKKHAWKLRSINKGK
jgi:starvation-inducible DNA-binding protein